MYKKYELDREVPKIYKNRKNDQDFKFVKKDGKHGFSLSLDLFDLRLKKLNNITHLNFKNSLFKKLDLRTIYQT